MLDRRSLYRDLTALALVALVVFLSLALVSYDRADPVATPLAPFHLLHQPNPSVHPANAHIHNVCGHWVLWPPTHSSRGWESARTTSCFPSHCWIFSSCGGGEIDMPALRMVGWIASLCGVTTIAAIAFPAFSPGPVIGSGGYLGALGKTVALMHFATIGGLILASSVTLGGLLLCTDYALTDRRAISVPASSRCRSDSRDRC